MMTDESKLDQFRNNHRLTITNPASFVYNKDDLIRTRRHGELGKKNKNQFGSEHNEIISPYDIKINNIR